MKGGNRILVIDDEPTVTDGLRLLLNDAGYRVETAATGQQGVALFNGGEFDLVVTDLALPDVEGFQVLKAVKEKDSSVEVIMITGYGSVDRAVEAVKAGAFYFVEKPFEPEGLLMLVERALDRRALKADKDQLIKRLSGRDSYHEIVGRSKSMQDIFELIESVAKSDANILIVGESGTGKEMIANAIHYNSLRAKQNFVKVNCAALPKELIESELFGHTKGAFTGAARDKEGLIGAADGGSLLLDEIAEMPVELQPKLLRVLQERQYLRLGSEKPVKVDFRLISATNRAPAEAIKDQMLREDLFYRISTITIEVPPLRKRPEDVQLLADTFFKRFQAKYSKSVTGFAQSAYDAMFAYEWPGNVRELENAIERAVLLSQGTLVDAKALPAEVQAARPVMSAASAAASAAPAPQPPSAQPPAASQPGSASAQALPPVAGTDQPPVVAPVAQQPGGLYVPPGMTLEEIERNVIYQTLQRTKGNKQAAANALGIYRPRLYSKIKKYNLTEFM
jgi:DNA-binding NtrC family response regulator